MLLYVIIIGIGFLHSHFWSTMFDIVAAYLSLYCTISNHPVAGCMIAKAFSIMGFSKPSILILYGNIRYTDSLSHGMASTSLMFNIPYLRFCFLFF